MALIAAEDTRMTKRLLARYDIQTRLMSHHAHTPPTKRAAMVERLEDGDIALVTDAGTPGVSDPGASLVRDSREAGHAVVAVPGPSAVAAALSISGLSADRYIFLGFLPRRPAARRKALASMASLRLTIVAFEAPHRMRGALEDLLAALGDREICVARELTKRYEQAWFGQISDAIAHWTDEAPRGEFTLVVAGAGEEDVQPWDDDEVLDALARLRADGYGAREASRMLTQESGRIAREIYKLWHGLPDGVDTSEASGVRRPIEQEETRDSKGVSPILKDDISGQNSSPRGDES